MLVVTEMAISVLSPQGTRWVSVLYRELKCIERFVDDRSVEGGWYDSD